MRASFLVSALAAACAAATRGVPASMEPTYARPQFTCLDKSATIESSRVNDEYCDCADGSDEPGTSACATSRFYCTNKGYRGKYVPSMYVNDGVCDCCDGSDEFSSRTKCANTCDADGATWRAAQAEAIRGAEEGARARLAYTAVGQDAAKARAAKIADAKAKLATAGAGKSAAEAAVAAAEADEAIKTASARAAAPVKTPGQATAEALGLDRMDKDAVLVLLAEWAREAGQGGAIATWLTERAREGKLTGIPADSPWAARLIDAGAGGEASVPEVKTEEGNKAREALAAIRSTEGTVQSEINTLEEEDRMDFGPDASLYKLKGSCFDLSDTQYKYSVCPFGRASQDGQSLGTFSGYKADASGEAHGVMLFTNGGSCWNGPARSLALTLKCGALDAFLSVSEPEKCTYAGVLSTPAVCSDKAARELRMSLEEPEEAGSRGEL